MGEKMNERQMKINNNIRTHVDYISRAHCGCIKINLSNGVVHENSKLQIAAQEIFLGRTVFTECKHIDTNRISDIYVADTNEVIEIACTETDNSLQEKKEEFERLGYKFRSIKCS